MPHQLAGGADGGEVEGMQHRMLLNHVPYIRLENLRLQGPQRWTTRECAGMVAWASAEAMTKLAINRDAYEVLSDPSCPQA